MQFGNPSVRIERTPDADVSAAVDASACVPCRFDADRLVRLTQVLMAPAQRGLRGSMVTSGFSRPTPVYHVSAL